MLPYGKLFLVLCGLSVVRHLRDSSTSPQSKRVVLAGSVVTLVLFFLSGLGPLPTAAVAALAAYTILLRLINSAAKST